MMRQLSKFLGKFSSENMQRRKVDAKKRLKKIAADAFDDIVKSGIIAIVMFFIGIGSTFIVQNWLNPETLPLQVHGYTIDDKGHAVPDARVVQVGSEGEAYSNTQGYFTFITEVEKEDMVESIEFYCIKKTYHSYLNCGTYPEGKNLPKIPSLRIDFQLVPVESIRTDTVIQTTKEI